MLIVTDCEATHKTLKVSDFVLREVWKGTLKHKHIQFFYLKNHHLLFLFLSSSSSSSIGTTAHCGL